jgi:HlyD family secretion protein
MSKTKIYSIAGIAATVLAVMLVSVLFFRTKDNLASNGATYKVKRNSLVISFTESGTIKAKEQTILKNELEGTTSIISIIPEGTRVEKGDLLVELDASTLNDLKIDQEISVQNAEAAYISANENLAVVQNQSKSDVNLAELTLEFAKQDLEKYINGDYPYLLEEADAKIKLAEEELARADQTLTDSKELAAENYISQMELQADELAQKKCELDKSLAIKSRNLLEEYTKKRQVAQYDSNVSQDEMALERTRRSANANIIQAEAELKAKESEYQRQQDKLKKLNDQLAKTKIYAPTDGLVIYATSAKTGNPFRSNSEPLDVGTSVQERQELIYLPAGDSSKAEISIHEAYLKKTEKGMPAIITVDALPGKTYFGTVATIAPLPDAQSMWMNPDLKVYNSDIYIDGSDQSLRTGMSCQAEIIIQQLKDVIYIPIQAVIRVGKEPTVYVKSGNRFEPRAVKTGLDNNKMIHIISGLKEGETVLLSPPLKQAETEQGSNLSEQNINGIAGNIEQKVFDKLREVSNNNKSASDNTAQPMTTEVSAGQVEMKSPENMTDAEKQEMRKKFENMSDEEKEQMRKKFGGRKPKE